MENFEDVLRKIPVLRERFIGQKNRLIKLYASEVGYDEVHVEFLFDDLLAFLDGFEILQKKMSLEWRKKERFYDQWGDTKIARAPWGKVLICSPGNSVIPLIPIFIISFCAMGNGLVLVPSRKSIKTATLLINIMKDIVSSLNWDFSVIMKNSAFSLWDTVGSEQINLLYFQGSSSSRHDIYSNCISKGIDLIYEGEGNQITIIEDLEESKINDVADILIRSKKFCRGQLCTSPCVVFIHSLELSRLLENGIKLGDHIVVDLSDEIVRELLAQPPASEILYFISYSDFDTLISFLRINYRYGLQVTLFSGRPELLENKIINLLQISRLVVNKDPTYQNSLLPWGGYRQSGFSQVLNFLEKASRTVVVERGS
ncbi:aldehyde dehydrogenase family protein [Dyadobacter sp. 32]|uniref:aldehyde dehydrogenase family protein n=1 Tax=Dyadobacter sp. 32 TaxID=538966 RepID=UPI0039C71F2B